MAFVYYNEIDPFVADWLEALIEAGVVADGWVDRTPIEEVDSDILGEFDQCHFFAGIGGWSYALRLAGWGDESPVWTGSCPCQPFSIAGRKKGTDDKRHLWPHWYKLIEECQPPVVFGEQVASPTGRDWLATVRLEMEALGYDVGAADLCAAGVGAPHIRQRLWFVLSGLDHTGSTRGWRDSRAVPRAQATCNSKGSQPGGEFDQPQSSSIVGWLANSIGEGRHEQPSTRVHAQGEPRHYPVRRRPDDSGWTPCEWLPCSDGKTRPTEPGLLPLAHGLSGHVRPLRAYGNSIVPQVAAEFIFAYEETLT